METENFILERRNFCDLYTGVPTGVDRSPHRTFVYRITNVYKVCPAVSDSIVTGGYVRFAIPENGQICILGHITLDTGHKIGHLKKIFPGERTFFATPSRITVAECEEVIRTLQAEKPDVYEYFPLPATCGSKPVRTRSRSAQPATPDDDDTERKELEQVRELMKQFPDVDDLYNAAPGLMRKHSGYVQQRKQSKKK